MKPTDVLMQEHRVIERGLDCLEAIAAGCASGSRLDADDARDMIDFFRNYADGCHHGKEEDQLFPLMEARGFPSSTGPLAVMRAEHDQGRAFVGAMERAIDEAAEGDPAATDEFVRNARGFTHMLRAHIQKEDHCLFPMADGAFGADDQARLEELFREATERTGSEASERYPAMAERLASRYGLAGAATGS